MSLETWVSIASLITVLIAIFAVTGRQNTTLRAELKGDIGGLRDELRETRAELKGDIGGLRDELREARADLKGDIARSEGRVETLDSRVYALAVGLRPHLESAEEVDTSS